MRIVVPYTLEVIDSIKYEYNQFFYPLQFLFSLLSLWLIYVIWKNKNPKIAVAILALFWLWVGIVYQANYYSSINWAGSYFAWGFVAQGLLLLWFGVFKQKIKFNPHKPLLLIALLLIIGYPLIQLINNKELLEIVTIGMLPDITVAFTLIILFMQTSKRVWSIFIIPFIWSSFSLYWNYLLFTSI